MSIICSVFRINDNGKVGYLAVAADNNFPKCITLEQLQGVCVSHGISKLKAFRFYGSNFGEGYQLINYTSDMFEIKTVRSAKDFAVYIKLFNPLMFVNPVEFGNIVFDSPYIHLSPDNLCYWRPTFEKVVDKKNLKIDSTGMIVEYSYQQPIFILLNGAKRHVPKMNSEVLLINLMTGAVTHRITRATADTYSEVNSILQGNSFVVISQNSCPIAGYKLRN